jgi:putative FmdB family regulatory protein
MSGAQNVPTYDYQCRSCGNTTEVIHSMLEEGPTTCEICGGQLRRVFYPTGIIFKGTGFYKTDSRSSATSDSSTRSTPSKTPSKDGPSKDSGGAAGSDGSSAGSSASESRGSGGSSGADAPKSTSRSEGN